MEKPNPVKPVSGKAVYIVFVLPFDRGNKKLKKISNSPIDKYSCKYNKFRKETTFSQKN
jgi:hypothetical protein